MMKKMTTRVLIAVSVLAAATLTSCFKQEAGTGSGTAGGSLPRNETLYFNGILWGAPTHFNPFNGQASFGMQAWSPQTREAIYETLFLYNMLDGKLYPQLAESYSWDGKTVTIKLRKIVKFNDGTPFTSADVAYTFKLMADYQTGGSGALNYIDSITTPDDYTVVIKGKEDNFNPKQIETHMAQLYIISKKFFEAKIASGEIGTDRNALVQYPNWEPVATGAYKPHVYDDTKVVLIRDDNYWGKDPSAYGKLPGPKYLAHNIYKDNAGGQTAYQAGQVDVSMQYIPQINKLPEFDKTVFTYDPNPPYYYPGVIPFIVFNTKRPGLDDKNVRKAIARAIDYDLIDKNAMSGYSGKFTPSLMLPTAAEQALIDTAALKPYQWDGVDIAGANKLLDDAGWVRGADGIRAKGGVRLSYKVECPAGWSDWQATLEVVAQSTKDIGVDLQTYYPEVNVWGDDRANGTFDIVMNNYGGAGVSSPWNRVNEGLNSADMPPEGVQNTQNWGRWVNQEANELIAKIAVETDPAALKTLWTRLNIIYLDEQPCAAMLYRPTAWFQFNTSVWQGWSRNNDGTNFPPLIPTDAYAYNVLFNLTAK
jgi:peptide/nickel transport system substrate-binding protein